MLSKTGLLFLNSVMKSIFTAFLLLCSVASLLGQSQLVRSAKALQPTEEFENVHVQPLHSDELASSYVIWIKEGVKLHRHDVHTEHVYVLAGKGEMRVGEEQIDVRKGDIIAIPKGTPHSVQVRGKTMKVLSVQSPQFKGEDRIFMD